MPPFFPVSTNCRRKKGTGKVINVGGYQIISELADPTAEVSNILQPEESSDDNTFQFIDLLHKQRRRTNQPPNGKERKTIGEEES